MERKVSGRKVAVDYLNQTTSCGNMILKRMCVAANRLTHVYQ